VLGKHEAAPILVDALQRLEYRGYDSAGIATVDRGTLDRRRAVGKLVNLQDLLVHDPLTGKSGIGHTRWATHGAPTLTNTHPHGAGRVAVVHNGIIENFRTLRSELGGIGIDHETETDTETVALLTRHHLDQGMDPRAAAEATIARLEGAYALCFLFERDEDLLIAARKGSPLAIGHGEGEMFVGSDAIALAPMTDRITYLEEGDLAVLTRDSLEVRDSAGHLANRPVKTIERDAALVDKGGHRHFMAKEIAEQPTVLTSALNYYLDDDAITLPEPGLDFTGVQRLTMVACGTAYLACLTAKYWVEQLAGIPVEVDVASEFRYREPPVGAGTVALLPILAGAEIGVASTKAFTCQLTVLAALALKAAQDKGRFDTAGLAARIADLRGLPGLMNIALGQEEKTQHLARQLAEARDILFLGRGPMYALAQEGALKLKEISYIHAEAYASGELKHGPIALVDKTVPVIVMAPRDALFDKTISNMQEVMARGGKVLLITDREGAEIAGDGVWDTLILPAAESLIAPILYAVPAQQLAYFTAVARGTDVDQPRNLAKSVTVE
jgi:glucosamine--fructose-6-phosphate aminotransferase (isomerizing)